jgi:hypothetical protein
LQCFDFTDCTTLSLTCFNTKLLLHDLDCLIGAGELVKQTIQFCLQNLHFSTCLPRFLLELLHAAIVNVESVLQGFDLFQVYFTFGQQLVHF